MKIKLSAQDLTRLTHVPRWNILPGLPRQSVADHTFLVCIICLDVFHRYRKFAFKELQDQFTGVGNPAYEEDRVFEFNKEWSADLGRLLQLAVLHDAPEAVFGDIATPCKHFIGADVIKEAESRVTTRLDWSEFIAPIDGDVFSQIIKFADTLEALRFLKLQPSTTDLQKKVVAEISERISVILRRTEQYTPLLYNAMCSCIADLMADGWERLSMAYGIPLSGEVTP